MKNYDYWKSFVSSGKIGDYLNYIACTQEESIGELLQETDRNKEGEIVAGINYRDRNDPVSHASW